MSLFDLLEIGAEVVSAGAEMKDMAQTKKQYPELGPILDLLVAAFVVNPLDHTKVPGKLIVVSKRTTGFGQIPCKCVGLVTPDDVLVGYSSEMSIHPSRFLTIAEFLARANLWFTTGCLLVKPFNSGLEIRFKSVLRHRGVSNWRKSRLVSNMVQSAVEVAKVFRPGFKSLCADKSALEAIKAIQTSGKRFKPYTPKGRQNLINTLSSWLQGKQFNYKAIPEDQAFEIQIEDEETKGYSYKAFVSKQSRVVFDSHLNVAVPDHRRSAVAEYTALANANFADLGHLNLNLENGEVTYRTGIDARHSETRFDAHLIENIVEENLGFMDTLFPGVKYIIDGMSPKEALEKSFRESFPDNQEAQEFANALLDYHQL